MNRETVIRPFDADAFIRWALDPERTWEERYTVERVVEGFVQQWHGRHQTGVWKSWEQRQERNRQRLLNPAYQPAYSEEDLRRTAEIMEGCKEFSFARGYEERVIRDIAILRFMPELESLSLWGDIADVTLIGELPALRQLSFSSPVCEDYRPLARCTRLTSLALTLAGHWPEAAGLESLQELEELSLEGNLLLLPKGTVFPKVRSATLQCGPLHARTFADLPQLPACEFLKLAGVERLDGIEALPHLRNLHLTGPVRDFTPLVALHELTCLDYLGDRPLDVATLARLPALRHLSLKTQHTYGIDKAPLRDLAPLSTSATLRELVVEGCPPLALEAAAINSLLPSCEDLFLADPPRAVPARLRMVVSPHGIGHPREFPHRGPDDPPFLDQGMREVESRWATRWAQTRIDDRIGHADWGKVEVNAMAHALEVAIHCYEVVERFPEIVEETRVILSLLRADYIAHVAIFLRVPPPKPTPAEQEMLDRFRDEEDQAFFDARKQEQLEALDRQYLYELKKQEGESIDPEEFAAPAREPLPEPPWRREAAEDSDEADGDLAMDKLPELPPGLWDDRHPLADEYNLMAVLTLEAISFRVHNRDIAIHLMQRQPDEDHSKEPRE